MIITSSYIEVYVSETIFPLAMNPWLFKSVWFSSLPFLILDVNALPSFPRIKSLWQRWFINFTLRNIIQGIRDQGKVGRREGIYKLISLNRSVDSCTNTFRASSGAPWAMDLFGGRGKEMDFSSQCLQIFSFITVEVHPLGLSSLHPGLFYLLFVRSLWGDQFFYPVEWALSKLQKCEDPVKILPWWLQGKPCFPGLDGPWC